MIKNKEYTKPWKWVPTLYYAEGLPYSVVMFTSVVMYGLLGIPNSTIAFYTSLLSLPWVLKPLWSPFVDIYRTKRWWIISMQFIIAALLFCVAGVIKTEYFFAVSMGLLMLIACASATHDISADGFYMIALKQKDQSLFVGIRSTFYRAAMITGQGLIIILAGFLARKYFDGDMHSAWAVSFLAVAILFLLIVSYHTFILPEPKADKPVRRGKSPWGEFLETFVTFFKKQGIIPAVSFILLFRLGEAQLVKIAPLFLLASRDTGGLGVTPEFQGLIYGTVGVIALLVGGIAGGVVISRGGLKKWIVPMFFFLNVPNLLYVYMSYFQPENPYIIGSCVALEQLGYGFGFTSYMLFLIMFCDGENKTAHYAIATGIMALGMMIPGSVSGFIQESWGYFMFFVWVLICAVPGFFIIRNLNISADYGVKT
ncbi:MAG: MFS transporter [Rikenellaceae bacterium]|nr:MFS transporter [Rikenellaceae bacterium]